MKRPYTAAHLLCFSARRTYRSGHRSKSSLAVGEKLAPERPPSATVSIFKRAALVGESQRMQPLVPTATGRMKNGARRGGEMRHHKDHITRGPGTAYQFIRGKLRKRWHAREGRGMEEDISRSGQGEPRGVVVARSRLRGERAIQCSSSGGSRDGGGPTTWPDPRKPFSSAGGGGRAARHAMRPAVPPGADVPRPPATLNRQR